ncbi:hypothetical protein EDB81DRAFT_931076 [Dactylonectria macrodidyma]|uniref:Peptidase metallopeptidase domain-containing protein n=1 Tax=Dactylonectria macrodidyma TaxID=307937 RepID=A0A9P9F1G3_9HYPO|nr:hypothetical protein EDB81DRAFT_931076 [Dactylonectria macrodidyma]
MGEIHVCTQIQVPDNLRAQAEVLAIQENIANGHQITSGAPPGPASLAAVTGNKWKNGRTLKVKILNGSEKVKGKVRQYASVWMQYANIEFVFVDSGDAEIRVNVDASGQSWSYMGTDNLSIAQGQQTMNFGWLTDDTGENEFSRVVLHEFGHALGCIHEHQSPAAGMDWNEDYVIKYFWDNYQWPREKVIFNIIQTYSGTTTQFTKFDTRSIMLYSYPAEFTKNGFSAPHNTVLSEADKSFIAELYPGVGLDIAYFNTLQVRPADQPVEKASSYQQFSKTYENPPSLAVGLNWLDVSKDANIRVTAFADNITKSSAVIHLDAWAGTILHSAGCTWFRKATDDGEFQIGSFNTLEDHSWKNPQQKTSREIKFARPYTSPPEVVVWLNSLDMDKSRNWRLKATATDITTTGFTIHLDTWSDSVLYSAGAAWIAYPANKPGVTSGSYQTPWPNTQLQNSGTVKFPDGTFQRAPKVLIAFSSLDVDCSRNLRLKLGADSVSTQGMNWHVGGWSDTKLHSSGASYIAFNT